jgi:ribosomal protein L20
VELDRKSLADLAVRDPQAFSSLVESAKSAKAAPAEA